MRHVIDAIAAQGRDGDTELLHVTKGEIAGLDALARRHFGKNLPRNPRTGIKEASLFRDWFGNDVGTVFDVAAPIAVGMIPGVGMPAAIAMGAGMGAANQGLGKGGTTESALLGGITGGIGAYGGAGLTEGLTSAGASSLAEKGVGEAAVQNLGTTGASQAQTAMSAMPNLPQSAATGMVEGVTPAAIPNVSVPGVATPPVGSDFGLAQQVPTAVPNPWEQMQSGFGKVTESPQAAWDFAKANKGNLTAMGTAGMMTAGIPGAAKTPTEAITGTNQSLPKSEIYYTPYGERRTRIVAAEGGLMSLADGEFGDYEGADEENNPRRYALGGGISNVGFKEGRFLQGPGGGLDDEIPARIDGKQEARLASGEFVVSSDVVSALGGGSSEDGARKLHDMMDRIRTQAHGTKKQVRRVNPKKVLPA